MSKVIIIGAGGVANVVAKKCAQNDSVFTEVLIATRTVAKADKIVAEIKEHMPDSRAVFTTASPAPPSSRHSLRWDATSLLALGPTSCALPSPYRRSCRFAAHQPPSHAARRMCSTLALPQL